MFSMGLLKVIQGSFEGCCKGIIKLKLISTLYGIKRGGDKLVLSCANILT